MARIKPKQVKIDAVGPTPEQQGKSGYELERETKAGQVGQAHYRRVRQVDALEAASVITAEQAKSLRHYRHHVDIADRSPTRDSLTSWMPKGAGGDGPGIEVLNAIRITADIENAVGSLRDILRAVVVEDQSLSQWAMAQYGSIEECYQREGRTVCQLKPRRKALDIARLDFRMAAIRVDGKVRA